MCLVKVVCVCVCVCARVCVCVASIAVWILNFTFLPGGGVQARQRAHRVWRDAAEGLPLLNDMNPFGQGRADNEKKKRKK